MPEQSILDARLAEIDRRLRTIQSGLLMTGDSGPPAGGVPAAGPAPAAPGSVTPIRDPAPPVSPGPSAGGDELAETERLVGQLHELAAAHERLLSSSRELLAGFADTLAATRTQVDIPHPAPPPPAGPIETAPTAGPIETAPIAGPPPVSVTAGPFADTAALRQFERSLSALPEVRHVTVREFSGTDRVVVEVHLSAPRS
ncbi:MAG TPA: hypothetical protein VG325_14345 [Solirubrobacteraceae bacterium]|nr:hypothetical protein [Solirubrobacteraceae bacterium]